MLSRIRGTPGKSLKPVSDASFGSEGIDFGPTPVFHEKFPNIGKPFIFEEDTWLTLGDGDGYQEYFERKGRVKNSVKWGQLKLFTSEMQFFNKFWNPKEIPAPLCVYVGSAPGTHIPFLARLFPWFEFHLYDPRDVFDPALKTLSNVKLFIQFFMDEDAKKYAGRNDVFFFSDIRTSGYNKDQFKSESSARENEKMVKEDMDRQMRWVEIIQPYKAQLKFRLPYSYAWQTEKTFEYFDGDIYRQPWAPQTSTETRLIPNLQLPKRKWDSPLYEKMMFYHNNVIREHAVFVNPLNGVNGAIDADLGLTQDYDSTVFVVTLQDYLKKFNKDPVLTAENSVLSLARSVLDNIGKGIITLSDIRAGIRGKLSPGSQTALRRALKESGEDDEE